MPHISPFPGVRYKVEHDPSQVTAPPYDVISDAEAKVLKHHPFNFAHLTLPGPGGYEQAGSLFRGWLSDGTLNRDEPSFYVYSTRYTYGGAERTTAGLVTSLELEPFGKGSIHPHEKTMPGPKADRLALMHATSANLEPLWFFTATALQSLQDLLARTDEMSPLYDFVVDGVMHQLWRIPAEEGAEAVAAIQDAEVVVADGHHRYETSLTYAKERSAEGAGPWDATLALIADPDFRPPTVLPIHRVVRKVEIGGLRDQVDIQDLPGADAVVERVADEGPGTVGVIWSDGAGTFSATGDLDTRFLADEILTPLGWPVEYQHNLDAALEAARTDSVVFVMAPVDIAAVAAMALRGETMPPKTTLFIPKPRSGLLLRDLHPG